MLLSAFQYILASLTEMLMVMFVGMSSWGGGRAGDISGELLSSYPGGWPGGRAVLPAGTHWASRLMATSLCIQFSTEQEKELCFELSEDGITAW